MVGTVNTHRQTAVPGSLRRSLLLNPSEAAAICRSDSQLAGRLRLHGIPCFHAGKQQELLRQLRIYRALLFQQRVLRLARNDQPNIWLHQPIHQDRHFEEIAIDEQDPEIKRVLHYAVRSVYALGLDYGQVTIGALSPHRVKVIRVQPFAAGENSMPSVLERAIEEYYAGVETEQHVPVDPVLGADPEFALRDPQGKMAIASDYLAKHGTVGCDSAHHHEESALHQWPLVELRPKPTADPAEMYRRICQALRLAVKKINHPELQWVAGGMPFESYPTGGHIHFSGIRLSFQLLRKLDTYLCLPLALVEDEGCRKRRPRFGFCGDFREKGHGGFEYRTLPSWLVTPTVTKGVFFLAKLIAASHWQLKAEPLRDVSVQIAYYKGDKERLMPIVRQLLQELARLPLYQQYREELQPFFAYLLAGKTWPAEQDFRPAWKLPVPEITGS
jgi:hypothetical protein